MTNMYQSDTGSMFLKWVCFSLVQFHFHLFKYLLCRLSQRHLSERNGVL